MSSPDPQPVFDAWKAMNDAAQEFTKAKADAEDWLDKMNDAAGALEETMKVMKDQGMTKEEIEKNTETDRREHERLKWQYTEAHMKTFSGLLGGWYLEIRFKLAIAQYQMDLMASVYLP